MSDGVSHINIYSRGQTELGRMLSNFSSHNIKTLDGDFVSVEGYWYWLNSKHKNRNVLRSLSGFEAKKTGRELKTLDVTHDDVFKLKIFTALLSKTIKHNNLLQLLKSSSLPFKHYYVNDKNHIIEPQEHKWLIEAWESIRRVLKDI